MTPDRPQRVHHLEAINSLGAIVDLQAFEDNEQATLVARVMLPFDPRTHLVLHGPYKGQRLKYAREAEVSRLLDAFRHVKCSKVQLRPWWRWWQRTPALLLEPSCPYLVGDV